jgi:hypothetical protein
MVRADVFDYIEVFYNRSRLYSHLGGISPEALERAWGVQQASDEFTPKQPAR